MDRASNAGRREFLAGMAGLAGAAASTDSLVWCHVIEPFDRRASSGDSDSDHRHAYPSLRSDAPARRALFRRSGNRTAAARAAAALSRAGHAARHRRRRQDRGESVGGRQPVGARGGRTDTIVVGVVGNLEPGKPDFAEMLGRYHKNPLFRGIRYGNLWGRDLTKEVGNAGVHRGPAAAGAGGSGAGYRQPAGRSARGDREGHRQGAAAARRPGSSAGPRSHAAEPIGV